MFTKLNLRYQLYRSNNIKLSSIWKFGKTLGNSSQYFHRSAVLELIDSVNAHDIRNWNLLLHSKILSNTHQTMMMGEHLPPVCFDEPIITIILMLTLTVCRHRNDHWYVHSKVVTRLSVVTQRKAIVWPLLSNVMLYLLFTPNTRKSVIGLSVGMWRAEST